MKKTPLIHLSCNHIQTNINGTSINKMITDAYKLPQGKDKLLPHYLRMCALSIYFTESKGEKAQEII